MKPYPHWAYRTRREFQANIRQRVRLALKAAQIARGACAYSPAQHDILAAIAALESAVAKQRAKVWR